MTHACERSPLLTFIQTLSDLLKAVSTAAATRREEAELLFSDISNLLLDAQIQGKDRRDLPASLWKTFSQFCYDLATVRNIISKATFVVPLATLTDI